MVLYPPFASPLFFLFGRCTAANYDDTACAVACFQGNACGGGTTCSCKDQDLFAIYPAAQYAGECPGAPNSGFNAWSITGTNQRA